MNKVFVIFPESFGCVDSFRKFKHVIGPSNLLIKWWVSISPKSLLLIGINPFKVCVTHSETQTTPSADTLFTSKKETKHLFLDVSLAPSKNRKQLCMTSWGHHGWSP